MKNASYAIGDGRVLFVDDGISKGKVWGVYYRKPNGSLKRFRPIPLCVTPSAAQASLDDYARLRGLEAV